MLFLVFCLLVGSTIILWNSKFIFLLLRQPPDEVHLSSLGFKIWSLGSLANILEMEEGEEWLVKVGELTIQYHGGDFDGCLCEGCKSK